jgi:RND family efflux transporter MFP subunit
LDAKTRQNYAKIQAKRYEQLLAVRSTSEENYASKRHEYQLSEASLTASEQQYSRIRSDYDGLVTQRKNLKLVAPTDGLITARKADPGTTLVAGQAAIELIDPSTIWINARFDQINAHGLKTDLPAKVVLRSGSRNTIAGHVIRVDPLADAVTEEMTAKVSFEYASDTLPPVGELAEITVNLPPLNSVRVINNASIKRVNGRTGVWQVKNGGISFATIKLGAADLDGYVQILDGLEDGAQVVVYSEQALSAKSRINIVDHISGTTK